MRTFFLLFVLSAIVAIGTAGAAAASGHVVARAEGADRIATAVAVSEGYFPSASDAVLGTAGDFPDALAAGALAARLHAPLLLTETDRLPGAVAGELERLGVERVWVLGGPEAVAPAVSRQLEERGLTVERIAGTNRYDTARQVAQHAGPSETGEVLVTLGGHPVSGRGWPDALAAASLAAAPARVPTLLTRHDRLPVETEAALHELQAASVLLVGGTSAVSTGVEDRIRSLGYPVERLAGESRYLTSVDLADRAMSRMGEGRHHLVIASGAAFPDALSAGPLAAAVQGPVVMVPRRSLNHGTDRWLRGRRHRLAGGVLIGGPAAVSELTRRQVQAALRGDPRPEPPPPSPPPSPQPEERVVGAFEGEASWYGTGFAGRTTACGEVYNPRARTAAHRSLPCGTRVRLTNTRNGAKVTVRINDRGPYAGGRVIDVSERAAEVLGFRSAGVAWVRGEILAR